MTDPTTLCIPKPRGSQRRRKVQKSRGGGGTNLRLYISAYVLFYLKNLEGAPKFGGDSKTPGGPVDFEVLSRLNLHCKNVFDMTIHNFFSKAK